MTVLALTASNWLAIAGLMLMLLTGVASALCWYLSKLVFRTGQLVGLGKSYLEQFRRLQRSHLKVLRTVRGHEHRLQKTEAHCNGR